jgi:hypothetical protein
MTKETTIERTHTTAAWEALKAIQGRAYKQGGLEGVLFMSASAFKESQAVQATCADKKKCTKRCRNWRSPGEGWPVSCRLEPRLTGPQQRKARAAHQ